MKQVRVRSEEETYQIGYELGQSLKPGSVVALTGDLGAGKTTLTKAIAKGLGVETVITSPTFLIVQEYWEGRLPLFHFDLYRIGSEEDLDELGYYDYFYGEGVSVVEWADQAKSLIPPLAIRIHIEYGAEEHERILCIE